MVKAAAPSLAGRRLRGEIGELAIVAAGAIPGALLRWQLELHLGPRIGGSSHADLVVNVAGSFLLGVLAGPIPWRTPLLLLGGIGFCGSLTTFCTWILNLVRLQAQGHVAAALGLLLASLGLGLLAAALGWLLSHRLVRTIRRRGLPRSPR